jgi:hypothetical protein
VSNLWLFLSILLKIIYYYYYYFKNLHVVVYFKQILQVRFWQNNWLVFINLLLFLHRCKKYLIKLIIFRYFRNLICPKLDFLYFLVYFRVLICCCFLIVFRIFINIFNDFFILFANFFYFGFLNGKFFFYYEVYSYLFFFFCLKKCYF